MHIECTLCNDIFTVMGISILCEQVGTLTLDTAPTHSTTFKVTLTGIRKDVPIDVSRRAFAKLFQVEPEQIDALFGSLPRVIKKKMQADQAVRYKATMENAGGICDVQEDTPQAAAIQTPPHAPAPPPPPPPPHVEPRAAIMPPVPAQNARPPTPDVPQRDVKPQGFMAGISRKVVWDLRNFLLLDIPKRSIALV
jgi:hypothetical protein